MGVMQKFGITNSDIDHMAAQLYLGDTEDNPLDYVSETIKGITRSERKFLIDLVTRRKKQLKHFFYITPTI